MMAQAANGTAVNGAINGTVKPSIDPLIQDKLTQINLDMKSKTGNDKYQSYHGDHLVGDKITAKVGFLDDARRVLTFQNLPMINRVLKSVIQRKSPDKIGMSNLVGCMSNDSANRLKFIEMQVKDKYERMLHPPLTYLGEAFKYRQADGKYNSVLSPHLGQAGAPYAKTVPSVTHPLGALPDPGDIFDKLLARQENGRNSKSGLSSMLIYHATLIIHDIFRTNDNDKNISDSSSYLDLSPLYGFTEKTQREVRDDKYKLGLLKPDTFAEDRLLRQPPGVCIMLVMYNRYHNYAATQIRRINENNRYSVPRKFTGTKLEAQARHFCLEKEKNATFYADLKKYHATWRDYKKAEPVEVSEKAKNEEATAAFMKEAIYTTFHDLEKDLRQKYLGGKDEDDESFKDFNLQYDAAWNKLDDDLFNTARLITSGMYIQVAIHDYLRALMGFHSHNTNFTLDPRLEIDHRNVSRGIGNQVTVEFNLLYRFHCAISQKDEAYVEQFMKEKFTRVLGPDFDPKNISLPQFVKVSQVGRENPDLRPPHEKTFGLDSDPFTRNKVGMFDDEKMANALKAAMDDPISNFGPRNVPKSLKPVEIMGIMQARKWEIGTLNDFRDFFGMKRHATFESVSKNPEIQNALRDLYDHPDKIELYPGIFCESDGSMNADPGPSELDSALWVAIFSDAITLVRSDRFYTVDWNTNSLTSWGMKEVTADNDIYKSSVFHRLIQRAFPGWFPYDSVRFFHPFYTSETNARYAREQGYEKDFRFTQNGSHSDGTPSFDTKAADPVKPEKPTYVTDPKDISSFLQSPYDFIHPAFRDQGAFPEVMQGALAEMHKKPKTLKPTNDGYKEDAKALKQYFTELTREIVKRESITMDAGTYQIDATRDYAIPVTTKAVADFLGFGDMLKSPDNPLGKYSENEIYQHITNCQIFTSYNEDETKLFKRRKAFKASLQALYDLTIKGGIYGWNITRWLQPSSNTNAMTKLGADIAAILSKKNWSTATCASMLVLIGLHSAYNTVLAFTSVLDKYLKELHDYANIASPPADPPTWFKVQKFAFGTDEQSFKELQSLLLDAERSTVRLPILRTCINREGAKINDKQYKLGDTIICDISAMKRFKVNSADLEFLDRRHNPVDHFAGYDSKRIAAINVSVMIQTIAQMRNPRRGHDAQGRLKRVRIDKSTEGYSNFVAPMYMEKIEYLAGKNPEGWKDLYTKKLLKPETETYLTAEWDEMVPFPNTWKIRFSGFGRSEYTSKDKNNTNPCGMLTQIELSPDVLAAPPYYQPQGPSHFGGTFAVASNDTSKVTDKLVEKMTGGEKIAPAAQAAPNTSGCKIGG